MCTSVCTHGPGITVPGQVSTYASMNGPDHVMMTQQCDGKKLIHRLGEKCTENVYSHAKGCGARYSLEILMSLWRLQCNNGFQLWINQINPSRSGRGGVAQRAGCMTWVGGAMTVAGGAM